ncbi:phosphatase PAP2 family protein [Marnyiella aurantia]|uniref:phosphatase PAP2 family protein n=1 Tax=Marnyiella aurantia TaxID=2758037 RepID=UPI001FD75AF0|nr:phosphatase PAP2 family protein [Marnyiella aurantia]
MTTQFYFMTPPTTNSSPLILISRFISNFFNPLTSLFLYYVYYSYLHYGWQQALLEFLPILFILILPITIWIYWNVKKGNYTNMDVSNRNQRKSLYMIIALALLLYVAINYLMDGQIDLTILFLFVLLIMMQISNFYIKSSMHTALNFYAAALFYTFDPPVGLIWCGIAILVGITRVVLKRHTVSEVLMGTALALTASFAYLYTDNLLNAGV